jgi:hypothetical protein
MSLTLQQVEALVASAIAKARADVVESWGAETLPLVRERLWHEFKAIDRIEESIRNEIRNSISGTGREPDQPERG